jgi:hypothetical protein
MEAGCRSFSARNGTDGLRVAGDDGVTSYGCLTRNEAITGDEAITSDESITGDEGFTGDDTVLGEPLTVNREKQSVCYMHIRAAMDHVRRGPFLKTKLSNVSY